ncbi:MAG: hypothetical protein QOF60_230 [Actinomycetota bacterium]|jgi:hypothetical protein|nr:hypothetical protein [Actinomycetota bacterium]
MKRVIVVVLLAFGLTVGGLGAASAKNTKDPDGPQYWGCVASITLDFGVCVANPLPSDVPPGPALPSLPAL